MLDKAPDFSRRLRNAFGCFATGVTVVTMTDEAGLPTGVTVNSFSSLSLDPALLLFSLGRTQASARRLETADVFNVNVLSADQEALAWQFARQRDDKFTGVPHWEALNGVPVIDAVSAYFVCRKHGLMDGGDHIIVLGEILDLGTTEAEPLLFHKGRMCRLAAQGPAA